MYRMQLCLQVRVVFAGAGVPVIASPAFSLHPALNVANSAVPLVTL
jgi:hypothetical protein